MRFEDLISLRCIRGLFHMKGWLRLLWLWWGTHFRFFLNRSRFLHPLALCLSSLWLFNLPGSYWRYRCHLYTGSFGRSSLLFHLSFSIIQIFQSHPSIRSGWCYGIQIYAPIFRNPPYCRRSQYSSILIIIHHFLFTSLLFICFGYRYTFLGFILNHRRRFRFLFFSL